MKFLILILLITPVATVVGQNNKVSIMISHNRAYRSYHSKQANTGKAWGANQQFKWGFAAGINYERRITRKVGLYTGIIFTNDGYQTKLGNLNFSDQLVSKDGYTLPPPSSAHLEYRFRFNYYNIGIPVGLNYYLQYKRIGLFVGGGINFNYLYQTKLKSFLYQDNNVTSKTTTQPKEYYKQINIAAAIRVGIEGKLSQNYLFQVFPNVSYTLTNVMDGRVIYKVNPFSIGIGFGIVKSF